MRDFDAFMENVHDIDSLIKSALIEADKYEYCMGLSVDERSGTVELCLDTSTDTYLECIKGEGADIGLLRCSKTNKVMGVKLPLYNNKLVVHHEGDIRINEGFLKE